MPQMIEVGHRFAHRKRGLVQVEWTLEQDGQHLGGRARPLAACTHDVIQAIAVVGLQLLNAGVDAGERLTV